MLWLTILMLHLFMEPDKFLLMKTQPSEAAPHTQIALTQSSEFVELLGESWQYSFGNAISSRARVMCMGLAACVSSPPEGACSCNHKVSVESPVSGAWGLSVCLSVCALLYCCSNHGPECAMGAAYLNQPAVPSFPCHNDFMELSAM